MQFKFQKPNLIGPALPFGFLGPYRFNHKVVYWDTFKNQYWDPCLDDYLTDDEIYHMISFINGKLSVSRLL